ncbi:hypothetical protein [Winogradskyella sp. 3972H.M.0a.05]|uniref:hypothetical protein n=1 Tax=Winogradskyella sp. 3972H.M.0a.05 TaxID=2950277 RepID=UPI00339B4FF1
METQQLKKPIPLRIIFILNGILMFLPFLFYYIVTVKGKDFGIEPMWMIYTGIGYILSFGIIVYSILSKKYLLFRLAFILTILISIPTQAYIGIVVAIASLVLSFNSKIEKYFLIS